MKDVRLFKSAVNADVPLYQINNCYWAIESQAFVPLSDQWWHHFPKFSAQVE